MTDSPIAPQLPIMVPLNAIQMEILKQCKLWQNDAFEAAAKLTDGWSKDSAFKALAESIRSLKHD